MSPSAESCTVSESVAASTDSQVPDHPIAAKRRSRLGTALRWGLALTIVGGLLIHLFLNRDLVETIRGIRGDVFLLLLLANLLHLLVDSVRYLLPLNTRTTVKLDWRRWFRLYILGRLANTAVPQTGHVYRAVALRDELGLPYRKYFCDLAFIVWSLVVFNLAVAGTVLLAADLSHSARIAGPTLAVWLLCIAVLITPLVAARFTSSDQRDSQDLQGWGSRLRLVVDGVAAHLRDYPMMARMVVASLLLFAANLPLVYFAFLAFGLSLTLTQLICITAAFGLQACIHVLPNNNLGFAEALYVLSGGMVGVGIQEAVLAGIALRASGYCTVGVLSLLSLRARWAT